MMKLTLKWMMQSQPNQIKTFWITLFYKSLLCYIILVTMNFDLAVYEWIAHWPLLICGSFTYIGALTINNI